MKRRRADRMLPCADAAAAASRLASKIAASPTRRSNRGTCVSGNKRVIRLNHGRGTHLTEIEENSIRKLPSKLS